MLITEIIANLSTEYYPETDEEEIGSYLIFPNKKKQKVTNIPLNQIKSRWEGDDKQNPEFIEARNNINNIKKQIKQNINKIPPIIIRRLPKQNTFQVIDGHHRYFAFKEMNIKTIPTIILQPYQITGQKFNENTPTTKLKNKLITNKTILQKNNKDKVYNIIDQIMKNIAAEYNITPKQLHDMWIKKYKEIPDNWIKNNP